MFFYKREPDSFLVVQEKSEAASWAATKIEFSDVKRTSREYWKVGAKLQRGGKYQDAVKQYDLAIKEAKKIYKIIDDIPDENIVDFFAMFIPYLSYGLFGTIMLGLADNNWKVKGASRAYARSINDRFIIMLKGERDRCARMK